MEPGIVRVALVCGLLAGCVESFGGSNLQMSFAEGVHVPGPYGDGGRPPADTHYAFYGIELGDDFEVDPETGEVTSDASFAFHLADFEIQPIIEPESPCFIEDARSELAGLHVSRVAEKLRQLTGITDPFDAPGADEDDVIKVLLADRRMADLPALTSSIKAVTAYSPAVYPPMDDVCAGDPAANPAAIPPPQCIDDASNARRLAMCEAFWAANPDYYEGSDKVFTNPLSGRFLGVVDGRDPRNASLLGGAEIVVDANLIGIDAIAMTWQYDCDPDDYAERGTDCTPLFPDGVDPDSVPPIGTEYMRGLASHPVRGVIRVSLRHRAFRQLSGELAIWPDLDSDSVHF